MVLIFNKDNKTRFNIIEIILQLVISKQIVFNLNSKINK